MTMSWYSAALFCQGSVAQVLTESQMLVARGTRDTASAFMVLGRATEELVRMLVESIVP